MHGPAPGLAIVCGWAPWALARVVAFILLGVVLSRPVLAAVTRRAVPAAGALPLCLAAAALLVLDVALKALLAPHWAVLLRPCLPAP